MTTDPLLPWDADEYGTLPGDEPELPPTPGLRRCGSVCDVGEGPWIGTLVCCTRPVAHEGAHAIALGDPGSPSFWEQIWE